MTASGRQLKKPVSVKRPEWAKKGKRARQQPPPMVTGDVSGGTVVPITQAGNSATMAPAIAVLRSTTRSVVRTG